MVGCLILLLAALPTCAMDEPQHLHTRQAPPRNTGSITVEPRKALLPTFPCSRCHEGRPADPRERRLVAFHTQKVLQHGTQKGFCYRCHSSDDIDQLHLGDGTLVSFDESHELCGSCHGDKFKDWKAGVHGLTTGDWSGDRIRRGCAFCHDPHDPHFPLMTPERAPARPRTEPPGGSPAPEERDGEGH